MEEEQAVLDWVNSFKISQQCTSFADLSDGTIISDMLHELCPEHFANDILNPNIDNNWALVAGNLRKLLRLLDTYFKEALQKEVDMSSIDVNKIAKNQETSEIMKFLELVVGVAVMCEDKAAFISNIFLLDHQSQTVLKTLVEQVMKKTTDLGFEQPEVEESGVLDVEEVGESDDDDDEHVFDLHKTFSAKFDKSGLFDELVRASEIIQTLQQERQQLTREITNLLRAKESLQIQLQQKEELQLQIQHSFNLQQQQQDSLQSGDDLNIRLIQAEAEVARLQQENNSLSRDLDSNVLEQNRLQNELDVTQKNLQAMKLQVVKLEQETHQQADKLDLALDQAIRLAKAEQNVEKYQKKLEEMIELKKLNKELNEKIDQYLDQIQELENSNKKLINMNKLVEQYKNRAVEIEREKFEAISSNKTKEQENERLQNDLNLGLNKQRMLEDEIQSLKSQILEFEHEKMMINESGEVKAGNSADAFEVESYSSLKEKCRRYEKELQFLKQNNNDIEGINSIPQDNNDIKMDKNGLNVDNLLQELEYIKTIKKEREDSLISSKKQVSDLQYEINKLQRSISNNEKDVEIESGIKTLKLKLVENGNTINLLEDTLKTKETNIHRLEQELENFKTKNNEKNTEIENLKAIYEVKENGFLNEIEELKTKLLALEGEKNVLKPDFQTPLKNGLNSNNEEVDGWKIWELSSKESDSVPFSLQSPEILHLLNTWTSDRVKLSFFKAWAATLEFRCPPSLSGRFDERSEGKKITTTESESEIGLMLGLQFTGISKVLRDGFLYLLIPILNQISVNPLRVQIRTYKRSPQKKKKTKVSLQDTGVSKVNEGLETEEEEEEEEDSVDPFLDLEENMYDLRVKLDITEVGQFLQHANVSQRQSEIKLREKYLLAIGLFHPDNDDKTILVESSIGKTPFSQKKNKIKQEISPGLKNIVTEPNNINTPINKNPTIEPTENPPATPDNSANISFFSAFVPWLKPAETLFAGYVGKPTTPGTTDDVTSNMLESLSLNSPHQNDRKPDDNPKVNSGLKKEKLGFGDKPMSPDSISGQHGQPSVNKIAARLDALRNK